MAFLTAAALPSVSRAAAPATCSRRAERVVPRAAAEPLNADEAMPMKEMYDVQAGKKAPICRCWKSKKHPLCDGSHNAWNKETGDKLGPLVVSSVAADE